MSGRAEFDEYALKYEKTMERSCAVSGETPDFYASGRMQWCRRRLQSYLPLKRALDFGCGTGGAIGYLFDTLGCEEVIGIDPSSDSLKVAETKHPGRRLQLRTTAEFVPGGDVDLVFCNGVFHHIEPDERLDSLETIRRALSNQGVFAFWENNPWNPVVRYGMSLNEFDRNAQTLSPRHAVSLLRSAGFRVQFVDYCFFFPHFARKCRGLESKLHWLPLGAQYLVVAGK